jgi:hypothetical protein
MSGILNLLLGSAAGVIKDAYFNLVTLLLNTTATNGAQNNTFLDSSTNNLTITRNGNTTQGTFTPFSQTGWSNYFGASNFLTTPSSSAFNLSSGDWTIEGWFWLNTNTDDTRLFTIVNSASDMYGCFVRSGTVRFGQIGVGEAGFSTINLNTWNHIAFSKTSTSTITCYINGASAGSTTSYTLPNANCTVYLAASPANFALATTNGYISNFRIVKGTAVYTSAFTPPTTPLTAITNTSLLTCQNNRFLDNSTNAFVITTSGTPSVQAFSPFAPTDAYSTSVVGGSGYFDGTGDYLNTPTANTGLQFGLGDFTVEFWAYPTNLTGSTGIGSSQIIFASAGSSSFMCSIWTGNVHTVKADVADLYDFAAPAVKQGTWFHVALSRATGVIKCFVNGVQAGSSTVDVNDYSGTGVGAIGANYGGGYNFTGYIAGLRALKGTALYTSNFSIPTAPPVVITNTSLLTNFTNAGIYDAAAKNDLETVGNAQVSTTTAQFGTTSMYFDGTGDCLIFPPTTNFLFGGDFTIEGWFNRDNGVDNSIFVMETSGANYFALNVASTGYSVYLNATGPNFSPSVTLSNNTWYHVALVRSGSTVTLYHNGTSVGSTTNSSALGSASVISYVGGINGGLKAYIDELRITKYARYTANFTPPAAAFPVQ